MTEKTPPHQPNEFFKPITQGSLKHKNQEFMYRVLLGHDGEIEIEFTRNGSKIFDLDLIETLSAKIYLEEADSQIPADVKDKIKMTLKNSTIKRIVFGRERSYLNDDWINHEADYWLQQNGLQMKIIEQKVQKRFLGLIIPLGLLVSPSVLGATLGAWLTEGHLGLEQNALILLSVINVIINAALLRASFLWSSLDNQHVGKSKDFLTQYSQTYVNEQYQQEVVRRDSLRETKKGVALAGILQAIAVSGYLVLSEYTTILNSLAIDSANLVIITMPLIAACLGLSLHLNERQEASKFRIRVLYNKKNAIDDNLIRIRGKMANVSKLEKEKKNKNLPKKIKRLFLPDSGSEVDEESIDGNDIFTKNSSLKKG